MKGGDEAAARSAAAPERRRMAGRERLQKFLAHAGVGSRRKCEELIVQGRVELDGRVVTELGTKVDPSKQKVFVDGERVRAEKPVAYLVNKPRGYVSTTSDERGRKCVTDLVPDARRLYPAGRLDGESQGLIVLTNDGELADVLTHPRYGVEKVYLVAVDRFTEEARKKLLAGVRLSEGKARADKIFLRGKKLVEITLHQGMNRQVRRMLAKVGVKAKKVTRVRVGPFSLGRMKPGAWRRLRPEEVTRIRRLRPIPGR